MADPRPGAAGTRPKVPPTRSTAAAAQAAAPAPAAEPEEEPQPSLGELVASASQHMSVLVRSEIELAKLELKVEAKKAAIGGAAIGAAAFLGLFALLLLSFAAAYGINSMGLAKGWSFLIVGGTYLLLAAVLIFGGAKSMMKIGPPRRTLRTTKETISVLKGAGRAAATKPAKEAGV